MGRRPEILGALLAATLAFGASAQEICPGLTRLLTDPPAGFVLNRAEPVGPQRWASRPFLPDASCVVWASRSAEAHNLRCSVNDGADPAKVAAFYGSAERSIDRCLASLPDGGKYGRRSAQVNGEGLTGAETKWVYDSDTARFLVALTNLRRTRDGSAYNSLSVEYLKY